MKQKILYLVLTIFLLSLFQVAVLGETVNSHKKVKSHDSVINETNKTGRGSGLEQVLVNAQETLQEVREKVVTAKEKYKQLKENYEQLVEDFNEKKEELGRLRNVVRECREDKEKCDEKKLALREGFRLQLLRLVKVMGKQLEKIEDRVEHLPVLTEKEKEEALAEIALLDGKVAVLVGKLEKEGQAAAELKRLLQEVKDLKLEIKQLQRKMASSLINFRHDNLIEKHVEFVNGMELRINELKELSLDTAKLERILTKFKENLAVLQEDHLNAKNKWAELNGGDLKLKDWKFKQEQVRQDLRKSKSLLKEFLLIYQELKSKEKQEESESRKAVENLDQELGEEAV